MSSLIQLGLVDYEPLVPRRRKRQLLMINNRLLKSYYSSIVELNQKTFSRKKIASKKLKRDH
ncbi:MAG: hypothetical protein GSR79_02675 [Desulfurococcales archaeon]|nr:hypothetical protein [Desulfurococcales archaeon]